MAQQKSEDRVVPDGGVMPAQPVGSSPGGQGKAVPVEEMAAQLRLPIATAEVPVQGSPGAIGVPKTIVNAQTGPSVTMEERSRCAYSDHSGVGTVVNAMAVAN